MSEKEQAFSDYLDAHPGDTRMRQVYADWLAQQGRHEEEQLQRWLALHGKYPSPPGVVQWNRSFQQSWDWWGKANTGNGIADANRLPDELFFSICSVAHSRREIEHNLLEVLQAKNWPHYPESYQAPVPSVKSESPKTRLSDS